MARCSICGEEHPLATMVTAHKRPEELPDGAAGAFPDPSDWWLADAEELSAAHPRSYFVPPRERRYALKHGELVRLQFCYGPHADREREGHVERMWVEVVEQHAGGHVHGRLRNTPVRLAALAIGDLVAFEPEHVASIDYADDELGYSQDQWPVVDGAVLRDDRAPDVVIRAPGPYVADQDEWWMLCQVDTAGPTVGNVNDLTDRFPGLAEPLRAGTGFWELAGGERETARWRRVEPDELERSGERQRFLAWLDATAAHMRARDGEQGRDTLR